MVMCKNSTQRAIFAHMIKQRVGIKTLNRGLGTIPVLPGRRFTQFVTVRLRIRHDAQLALFAIGELRVVIKMEHTSGGIN